eukprot:scaffold40091_cov54-Attheya_sp.AAC.4
MHWQIGVAGSTQAVWQAALRHYGRQHSGSTQEFWRTALRQHSGMTWQAVAWHDSAWHSRRDSDWHGMG